MSQHKVVTGHTRALVIGLQLLILRLSKYWPVLFIMVTATFLTLAVLAPAFMSSGQIDQAQTIYDFLAVHNHQLPQRSYFLFGQQAGLQSYELPQLIAWGADPENLNAFVGNPEIGFKMGFNHRMTAIFTAMTIGFFIWLFAGQRPRLRFVPFLLMTLPLFLDGLSHLDSDTGDGFRQTNVWVVSLTGGLLPESFYTGTTIGSLNWLLRTVTGLLFGLGLSWYLLTYLAYRFALIRLELEPRLQRAGILKSTLRQTES